METPYSWLAPYAYGIVLLGFLIFLFRVFENYYSTAFQKPLIRQLLAFKKLPAGYENILREEFSFYSLLSKKHQKQFAHRVAGFIECKKFVGRQDFKIHPKVEVLVAATACMLSFGRKNDTYNLIEYILIYPEKFYSTLNQQHHKGEFNPQKKVLVLS